MSKVIVVDDCEICDHPRIVKINEDFGMKLSYNHIFARNNIDSTKENIKKFNTHFAKHFTTPEMAMTRSIINQNAIEMYNIVVESNFALKQIDILMSKLYMRLEETADNEEYHKFIKNLSDLLKRKNEYLHFHYKISGKSTQDDLMKASLVKMVQKAGEMVGEDAVNEIRKRGSGKTVIEHIFENNPHLEKIMNDLASKQSRKQKKYKEVDYEIVDE